MDSSNDSAPDEDNQDQSQPSPIDEQSKRIEDCIAKKEDEITRLRCQLEDVKGSKKNVEPILAILPMPSKLSTLAEASTQVNDPKISMQQFEETNSLNFSIRDDIAKQMALVSQMKQDFENYKTENDTRIRTLQEQVQALEMKLSKIPQTSQVHASSTITITPIKTPVKTPADPHRPPGLGNLSALLQRTLRTSQVSTAPQAVLTPRLCNKHRRLSDAPKQVRKVSVKPEPMDQINPVNPSGPSTSTATAEPGQMTNLTPWKITTATNTPTVQIVSKPSPQVITPKAPSRSTAISSTIRASSSTQQRQLHPLEERTSSRIAHSSPATVHTESQAIAARVQGQLQQTQTELQQSQQQQQM